MAFTEKESKKLDETYKATIEVRALLIGVGGNPGMLSHFEDLSKSFYGFKRTVISIVSGLIFTGIITAAIILLT